MGETVFENVIEIDEDWDSFRETFPRFSSFVAVQDGLGRRFLFDRQECARLVALRRFLWNHPRLMSGGGGWWLRADSDHGWCTLVVAKCYRQVGTDVVEESVPILDLRPQRGEGDELPGNSVLDDDSGYTLAGHARRLLEQTVLYGEGLVTQIIDSRGAFARDLVRGLLEPRHPLVTSPVPRPAEPVPTVTRGWDVAPWYDWIGSDGIYREVGSDGTQLELPPPQIIEEGEIREVIAHGGGGLVRYTSDKGVRFAVG